MIKRKFNIILIAFLLSSIISLAQKNKKSPENIELIESKFSLAPIYVNEYTYLIIKSRDNNAASQMRYKPNIIGSVGARISYKGVSVSYVHALPQPGAYGKTKSTNLTFNLQKRVYGLKLFWNKYEGMYLDTLDRFGIFDDVYKQDPDSSYIIRPDIKVSNIGFENHFVFRSDFSINAALEQSERQKKTAGSFMLSFGANYLALKSNKGESMIVESQQKYYPRITDLYDLSALNVKIAPGIGYSFIMKKYFSFSLIFMAGPNVLIKWYDLDQNSSKNIGAWMSFYYQGKAALGYNGRIFMANLIYSIEQDVVGFRKSYNDREYDSSTNIKLFREYLKFTLGFRIL